MHRAALYAAAVMACMVCGESWGDEPTVPSRTCEQGPRDVLEVDAVELIRTGKDVPGLAEHSAVHGAYTYRFKNVENKATFEADPARYEIQLGGACARMGALSGTGSPKLHAVHEQQIYIFASGACRNAFLKNPTRYIEQAQTRPEGRSEAVAKGKEQMTRVLEHHGGVEAIKALKSLRFTTVGEDEHKGEKVKTGVTLRIGFDTGPTVRMEERWGQWAWGSAVQGEVGWLYDTKMIKGMVAQQREALRRVPNQTLAAALRAATDPEASVSRFATPKGGDPDLEYLLVWSDGCLSVLGTERATGRVATLRFCGRGPDLTLGEVEHRFSDYRPVAGVLLPFTVERRFEGEQWKDGVISYSEIVANEPIVVDDLARAK